MAKIRMAIHPDDDAHYSSMGLTRGIVEPWEDGMRTDGSRGTYEWWYFDSRYPDGTILVIFFFSKSPIQVNGPIKPTATMELTLPDGRKFSEEVYASVEESSYAKGSRILGDNANHTLKFLPAEPYTDVHTGKPVYGKVVYEYETPEGELYRITYSRRSDISRQNFADLLPAPIRLAAQLVGFEGSYLRFEGSATIERLENGSAVEQVTEDSAVWELMYFGKAGADQKENT